MFTFTTIEMTMKAINTMNNHIEELYNDICELNTKGFQTKQVAKHVDEEHKQGWIDAGEAMYKEARQKHSLITNIELDIEELETETAFMSVA